MQIAPTVGVWNSNQQPVAVVHKQRSREQMKSKNLNLLDNLPKEVISKVITRPEYVMLLGNLWTGIVRRRIKCWLIILDIVKWLLIKLWCN